MGRAILSILILAVGFTLISEQLGRIDQIHSPTNDRALEAKYESHFHYDQPYYQNLMKIRHFTACGDTAMVASNGKHKPITEFWRSRIVSYPAHTEKPE